MSGSIALFVLWIAMMGEVSVANVVSGLVVVALVNWLFVHNHSRYVQLKHGSAFIGAIVANAITLTPGTMSLELRAEDLTLSVHVLGKVNEAKFQADVLALEDMVANAVRERKS